MLLSAMTQDSPLDRLVLQRWHVFLLGVKHISNSMVLLGESHAQLRYLDILFVPDCAAKAVVKSPLGKETVHIKEFPGCRTAFGVVELPLDLRGLIRCARIG